MKQLHSLRVPYEKDPDVAAHAARHLGISPQDISHIRIQKRSLDARNRRQFYWVYSLQVFFDGEVVSQAFAPFPKCEWKGPPPLILGAGPAGLFAAWTLIAHGIRPILFERGERTSERMRKISRYWRTGELDPDSNVGNGEGGAGTFSDGKLITRIKSPHIARVMQALVDYGAPPEILYAYDPHVGSNRIRTVIRALSDDLIARGADLRFETRVEGLELNGRAVVGVRLANGQTVEGSGLILASGHSASEFFKILHAQGVLIEPKPFALGLRIEHPQSYINHLQYGREKEGLDAAAYKFTHHLREEDMGVYTFCMCPGGYVISSTTDRETTVVNGMSNANRNSPWANAAVVASVSAERVPGDDPFKLMTFQRAIERRVYQAGSEAGSQKAIPAQRLEDFLNQRKGPLKVKSSSPSGVIACDLSELLPRWIYDSLCTGLLGFDEKRRGFALKDALLHAVESRTSSPIRMVRNPDTLESVSTPGLFPCGEGPGYAGGITSAAVDGINAALGWIRKFSNLP